MQLKAWRGPRSVIVGRLHAHCAHGPFSTATPARLAALPGVLQLSGHRVRRPAFIKAACWFAQLCDSNLALRSPQRWCAVSGISGGQLVVQRIGLHIRLLR